MLVKEASVADGVVARDSTTGPAPPPLARSSGDPRRLRGVDATARVDLDPAALDAADPLARFRDRSAPRAGARLPRRNSLGRPTKAAIERVTAVAEGWATRVIRGWDEGWLELPLRVGDLLARARAARPGEVLATTHHREPLPPRFRRT